MAAIHDLLAQVQDEASSKMVLLRAITRLRKKKKRFRCKNLCRWLSLESLYILI